MDAARRIFAREFESASGADEECGSIFIVGALNELRDAGEMLHARVADPTGAFPVVADRSHPDALATLRCIEPPAFVAVFGSPKSRPRPTVSAEMVTVVNRTVRDLWVLTTADHTLRRLESAAHDRDRIRTLAEMVRDALSTVRPDAGVQGPPPRPARDVVFEIVGAEGIAKGISLETLIARAVRSGLSASAASSAVESLLAEGDCYSPTPGMIKIL